MGSGRSHPPGCALIDGKSTKPRRMVDRIRSGDGVSSKVCSWGETHLSWSLDGGCGASIMKPSAKKRSKQASLKPCKVIIEKYADGYIAYPLGLKGVVVGEGDTYEEAMADVKSAIRFHVETFGK